MASIIPLLIQTAGTEWEFFGRGTINLDGTRVQGKQEFTDGAWQRIADYWQFIGGPYKNLTGKDRGTPWSAAFVSFCMHVAGAGTNFPYSAGHSAYLNKAISNALAGRTNAPIVGQRIDQYAPQPGDLIGYWRGENKITFDNATTVGWYESHTDIVIGSHPDKGYAYSIGGNVSDSVTRRQVKLNSAGLLVDQSQNWFAIVQNRM